MSKRTDISPAAVAVWRFLRDQGGYWTTGEIGRAMDPEGDPQNKVGKYMRALRNRRCVSANPRSIRVLSYGVTPFCFPPEGESLEPNAVTHSKELS
jgi:hypothetical protein